MSKRKVLMIQPAHHGRLVKLAKKHKLQLFEVTDCILDYTIPLIESGTVEVTKPKLIATPNHTAP